MSNRNFMGLPIEGDISIRNMHYAQQEPIENLHPYFQAAFDSGVKAIKWRQYTPYFNDGEPCEFSVREAVITSNQGVADKWLDYEGYYEFSGLEIPELYPHKMDDEEWLEQYGKYIDEWSFESPWRGFHPDGWDNTDFPNVPVDEGRFELALLEAFGDHTTVIVTPDRVVQFWYDHE